MTVATVAGAPVTELVQSLGKYLIALAVVIGCFFQISQVGPDHAPAWALLGLIVGWIVRDSAGNTATNNAIKTIAAVGPGALLR